MSILICLFSEASSLDSPPKFLVCVSLLCSHFLSLGWDNPPCRGLQSAGQPGKSLNYPFALKLKPNHKSPQSVKFCTPASLRLIVGLYFVFFLLCCWNGNIKLKSEKERLNEAGDESVNDLIFGSWFASICTLFWRGQGCNPVARRVIMSETVLLHDPYLDICFYIVNNGIEIIGMDNIEEHIQYINDLFCSLASEVIMKQILYSFCSINKRLSKWLRVSFYIFTSGTATFEIWGGSNRKILLL